MFRIVWFLGLALIAPLAIHALENQTITWLSPTNPVLRLNVPHELMATASSGLTLNYRVLEGPAAIHDNRLTITSVAPVAVVAEQSGDETYRARALTNRFNANPVTRLTKLGRVSGDGPAFRLKLQAGLAYVAERTNGLQVYDVSLSGNPVRVGGIVTGGDTCEVQVRGNRAYLAEGLDGLRVVDVSNPAQPSLLGVCDTPGFAEDLDVVGALAYVADSSGGLQIIDVGDPAKPAKVGEFVTPVPVFGVRVAGSVAYVAHSTSGLQILDVSVPSALSVITRFTGGSARAVDLDPTGRLALVCGSDGFRLVDISVPAAPALLASSLGPAALRGQVRDGIVHVIRGSRLEVFALANGALERLASHSVTNGTSLDVEVAGTAAFLACGSGGMEVVGIKRGFLQTISFPPDQFPYPFIFTNAPLTLGASASSGLSITYTVERGSAVVDGNLLRLVGTGVITVRAEQPGDDLYLPAQPKSFGGLVEANQAIIIESPTHSILPLRTPHELRASATSGRSLTYRVLSGPGTIEGTSLTLSAVNPVSVVIEQAGDDVFQSVSVTNVFNSVFRVTGTLSSSRHLPGNARDLEVVGSLAYIVTEDAGLQIVDVGNPSEPVRLGGFDTDGQAKGLHLIGNVAYVADGASGLQIIDVSNPAVPIRLGSFNTPGDAQSVKVAGTLAYVADGTSGLQIVDISNPANPNLVGSYFFSGDTKDVDVTGSMAYAIGVFSGLEILDVSQPTNPLRLGKLDLPEAWMPTRLAVQVVGSTAYVSDGASRLRTVDVAFPTGPQQLGIDYGSDASRSLHVVGTTAYVVGGNRLDAYDVSLPSQFAWGHLGGLVTGGEPSGVRVLGRNAFVANRTNGLQVFQLEKKLPQTINFSLPQSIFLHESPFLLAGQSSLGLPVAYRVINGPAEISGEHLVLTGEGAVAVEASQPGDADHNAALPLVAWTVAVTPPFLLSASHLPDTSEIVLTIRGTSGTKVQIQRTTGLFSDQPWGTITNLLLSDTPAQVIESTQAAGFYRVIPAE